MLSGTHPEGSQLEAIPCAHAVCPGRPARISLDGRLGNNQCADEQLSGRLAMGGATRTLRAAHDALVADLELLDGDLTAARREAGSSPLGGPRSQQGPGAGQLAALVQLDPHFLGIRLPSVFTRGVDGSRADGRHGSGSDPPAWSDKHTQLPRRSVSAGQYPREQRRMQKGSSTTSRSVF